MLQRPRGEDVRPGRPLERVPLRAEADDDGARVDVGQRLEQEVDPLLLRELADVDHGRRVARQELGEALGVPVVWEALGRPARVRRVPARLLQEGGERQLPRRRTELVDVDAGRDDLDPIRVRPPAEDLLDNPPDVLRPDEHGASLGERLARPGRELLASPDRELELRAVRLDHERHPDRHADRRSEEHVVQEEEVGRQVLAHDGGVPLDEVAALGLGEVLQRAGLEVLVTVEDEDGERPAGQVGPDDPRAPEVVALGMRLLAEDDHLVPETSPGPGERARVDVRAGPAQEVAVPEEDLHAGILADAAAD